MDAYWIEGTASGLPGFWSNYAEGDNMGINTGGGWMGEGTQPDPPASTHAGLTGEDLRAAQDSERQGGTDKDKEERDAHNERMAAE